MNKRKTEMPMYGVGPLYVGIIIALTLGGILLNHFGLIDSGIKSSLKIPFIVLGILLIIAGIAIWCLAVFREKIDKGIEQNALVTTGVYGWCRNPIYTAFMMICTAFCLFTYNLWLLILPIVYWVLLTVFMKCTEEKWLYDAFKDEYVDYCEKVNRCIPFFPKKNKK